MLDYYVILQVEENATQEEIKQAYHRMARLFHPDNFKGAQKDAEEHMAKINKAYATLSDENKRTAYDFDRKNNENVKSKVWNNEDVKASEKKQEKKGEQSIQKQGCDKEKKNNPRHSCLAKIIE